jgi:hypothetical protein
MFCKAKPGVTEEDYYMSGEAMLLLLSDQNLA